MLLEGYSFFGFLCVYLIDLVTTFLASFFRALISLTVVPYSSLALTFLLGISTYFFYQAGPLRWGSSSIEILFWLLPLVVCFSTSIFTGLLLFTGDGSVGLNLKIILLYFLNLWRSSSFRLYYLNFLVLFNWSSRLLSHFFLLRLTTFTSWNLHF